LRQNGESEEDSLDDDDGDEGDDESDDSEAMATHLDRILEGPPRADVDTSRVGASSRTSGGSHDGLQREAPQRRSRADTPPAPAHGRAPSQLPLPPVPRTGHRVKTMTTGALTRGHAVVAASSHGEGGRRSASPGTRKSGDVDPRPAPASRWPAASTRGGPKPAGRGTGRQVVLPVG